MREADGANKTSWIILTDDLPFHPFFLSCNCASHHLVRVYIVRSVAEQQPPPSVQNIPRPANLNPKRRLAGVDREHLKHASTTPRRPLFAHPRRPRTVPGLPLLQNRKSWKSLRRIPGRRHQRGLTTNGRSLELASEAKEAGRSNQDVVQQLR